MHVEFDPKNVKILLVDDSPLNLKLLEHTLKQHQFQTNLANHGQEALDMVAETDYDLILLDIMMPILDGFGVMAELRKGEKTKDIPVIFITAMNDSEAKVKGLNLGANDFITKPFNASELVARVRTQLRLKFLNERIKKQHNSMLKDLSSAQKIQKSLLPTNYPESEALSFAATYVPCTQVGGDLYDVFRIDDDHLGLYICDVSGHGVAAAMITVFIKQTFDTYIEQMSSPERLSPMKTMEKINNAFSEEDFEEYYATIFYAVINEKTLEMKYSCAAHNGRPFIVKEKDQIVEIGHNALAVGWFKDAEFQEETVSLTSGEKILFYTDGIFEAADTEDKIWGLNSFKEFTLASHFLQPDAFCDKLLKTLEAYTGRTEQEDDIALLIVNVK